MEKFFKKSSLIMLMMLIVVNSFAGSLSVSASDSQSFTLNNEQMVLDETEDAKVTVTYDWTFIAGNKEVEELYTFQLPSEVKLIEEQSGNIAANGIEIGTYHATDDGSISVMIGANQTENGFGTIALDVSKQQKVMTQSTNEEGNLAAENKEENVVTTNEEENTVVVNEVENTSEESGNIITENILTSAELSFEDTQGSPIGSVNLESIIEVKYTWELPNSHGYKAGATFTFELPEELAVYEQILDGTLKFGQDVIATYTVDMEGKVTIVFNEFIEEHSNINGTFEVLSRISETVVVTEDKIVEVTPIKGQDAKEIPLNFTPVGSTIDKQGIPNRAYNAETITWTASFNKSLDAISNAKLIDPIQDGQILKSDSIKIYKLITKMDGTTTLGEQVTSGYKIEKTESGEDFVISFDNTIESAYQVVYTTEITDEDKTKFENEATLVGEGFIDQKASVSVNVSRGTPLAKSSPGYSGPEQTITWEIKYNYNEKTIAKETAILTDLFNGSQEFVKDSLEVYRVTIDSNGKESSSVEVDADKYSFKDINNNDGKNGFELQFKEGISEAYKIQYKTKATDRVFENTKIINEVIAGGNAVSATRDISQQILTKSHGTPNYNEKTIPWTITFNSDKYTMTDVVLTETFPNSGLKLKVGSLMVTKGNESKPLAEGTDYTLKDNGENGFEIKFTGEIKDKYTIKYTTDFNYENRKELSEKYLNNKAQFTWKENGVNQEKVGTAKFTPDNYSQANGYKNGSYNAVNKEITWNIGINYNLKILKNANIVDEIIGDQELLPDSLKVYKMNLTGGANGIEKGELLNQSEYTITWNPNDKLGFKVEFTNEINTPYLIEYKTSLKDKQITGTYHNAATLNNESDKVTELPAKVSVLHGGSYTSKIGEQKGKTIDWKVDINFSQSTISNVKIIDTASSNQLLLENTFELYATNVDNQGKVTAGER